MTDLACVAPQLRHCGGHATGCRHLPEPAPRVREHDLALGAPAGSKDGRLERSLKVGLAEFDDGSSTDGNFPQRASGVEAQGLPIRREERIGRALGAGDWDGVQLVEATYVELDSALMFGAEDQRTAIGC